MDAKVSVIVATYKRYDDLFRALCSLKAQTFNDLEIIIIDDNADEEWNDKVSKAVARVSDSRIMIIKNTENLGSAESRNIGIKASTGEYVTFLDDDDEYLPEKIEKQYKAMLKENADFSLTNLSLYYENGKLCEKRNRRYLKKTDKKSLLRYHLLYHMSGTDSMMFKRDYLIKIGMFPPINVGDEYYLMMNALKEDGKFIYLDRCDIKAYVHVNEDGLSSGQGKLEGENKLYQYKLNNMEGLSFHDRLYVKMRHYAVIAFAYKRMKNYGQFIENSVKSFLSLPISCISLLLNIKN